MSPDLYLHFGSTFATYLIKVAAAYLLCSLLVRFFSNPSHRFLIWLSFILGSAGYWLVAGFSSFSATLPSSPASALAGAVNPQLLLPITWQHTAVIVGKGMALGYAVGLFCLLLILLLKRMRLQLILKHARRPSGEVQALFTDMCRSFGVRRCELLILDKVSSPATVYSWRPRILLPEVCEQLGAGAQMADILYHELAHIVRRDFFWANASNAICGLLFFHPAVWQARKHLRIERELACDLAVVTARPEHRADYASTLTCVARMCLPRRHPAIGIDFAASPSLLTHRVKAVLAGPQESTLQQTLSRWTATLALVGAYGFASPALAVFVGFAHSGEKARSSSMLASVTPSTQIRHSGSRGRIKTGAPSNSASLITNSPAYRLQASPLEYSSAYRPIPHTDHDNQRVERPEIHMWTESRPGSSGSNSSGVSLRTIVLSTVGAIVAAEQAANDHTPDPTRKRDDHPAGGQTTVKTN
jgi:beta-lactamase regulating signal transducer with metallopeptidase domain